MIQTLRPSDVQSDTGHPLSVVEKGHPPFELWRYQELRFAELLLLTYRIDKQHKIFCMIKQRDIYSFIHPKYAQSEFEKENQFLGYYYVITLKQT